MNVKRDYATTFATEAVVIACYLLAFRLVAARLGPTGFGEYALSRRVLSVLAPLALLGVDLAVTRLVAFGSIDRSRIGQQYPLAAILMMSSMTALLSTALLILQRPLAVVLFGSSVLASLITPLPLLVLGNGIYAITYGYMRGNLKIQRANLLAAACQGVVPVAAIFVSDSVPGVLAITGVSWTVISCAVLLTTPLRFGNLRQRMSDLAAYGVPRAPGGLLQFALFALPGILIAHIADIRTAGLAAFGVAGLGLIGSALSPVGFVLLPLATRMVARESFAELRRQVVALARISGVAILMATVIIEVLANRIISGYLGLNDTSGTMLVRLLFLAALPWGAYVVLRSVLDARHVKAINTRNMAIAFGAFVIATFFVWLWWWSPVGVVLAFVVSLYLLALLTIIDVDAATRPAFHLRTAGAAPAVGGDVR